MRQYKKKGCGDKSTQKSLEICPSTEKGNKSETDWLKVSYKLLFSLTTLRTSLVWGKLPVNKDADFNRPVASIGWSVCRLQTKTALKGFFYKHFRAAVDDPFYLPCDPGV